MSKLKELYKALEDVVQEFEDEGLPASEKYKKLKTFQKKLNTIVERYDEQFTEEHMQS